MNKLFKTKDIVENLLYLSNNHDHLKKILKLSRVLVQNSVSGDRIWYAKNNNILELEDFTEYSVLTVFSTIITVYIIQEKETGRGKKNYRMLKIVGENTSYYSHITGGLLFKMIKDSLDCKNILLPKPIYRQVYYFNFKKKQIKNTSSSKQEQELLNNIQKIKNLDNAANIIKVLIITDMNNKVCIGKDYYNVKKSKIANASIYKIVESIIT